MNENCPKCEKGQLEKHGNLVKCNKCDWKIEYNQYLDLKKVLDGKLFTEGDQ